MNAIFIVWLITGAIVSVARVVVELRSKKLDMDAALLSAGMAIAYTAATINYSLLWLIVELKKR